MPENPAEWRSTVDPNTGRTYWYHRKTRVSTWVKPDFGEDAPVNKERSASIDRQPSLETHGSNKNPEREELVPKNSPKEKLIETNLNESIDESDDEEETEEIDEIEDNNIFHVNSEDELKELYNKLTTTNKSCFFIGDQPHLVSDLVKVVIQTKTIKLRVMALQCLYVLSNFPPNTSTAFHTNQSWVVLTNYYRQWTDIESFLLLLLILCNLHIGTSYWLLSKTIKNDVCDVLFQFTYLNNESKSDNEGRKEVDGRGRLFLTGLMDFRPCLVDEGILQKLCILGEKGHFLPALFLITIAECGCLEEKRFERLVQLGILPCLQSLCISKKLEESFKSKGRQTLLKTIKYSPYARERLVDMLLDLTTDLNSISMILGPEPLIYQTHSKTQTLNTQTQNNWENCEDGWEDLLPHCLPNFEDNENAEIGIRYRKMSESGFFEIPEDYLGESRDLERQEQQQQLDSLYRDVEWIPRSGTPWRLSSVVLWSRCPALRDVISKFWDEGGGSLELTIDATDEVLSVLCRYMHSSILLLPDRIERQLELLRVSWELGMKNLFIQVQNLLKLRINQNDIKTIISFCETFQFKELRGFCLDYLQNPSYITPKIQLNPPSGEKEKDKKEQYKEQQKLNNKKLHEAIFASLQDVSVVLKQDLPEGKHILHIPTTDLNSTQNVTNYVESDGLQRESKNNVSIGSVKTGIPQLVKTPKKSENSDVIEEDILLQTLAEEKIPKFSIEDIKIENFISDAPPLTLQKPENNEPHLEQIPNKAKPEKEIISKAKLQQHRVEKMSQPRKKPQDPNSFNPKPSINTHKSKQKPKSGGIYGLLLEARGESGEMEYTTEPTGKGSLQLPVDSSVGRVLSGDTEDSVGSKGISKGNRQTKVIPTHPSKVPGKVMKEKNPGGMYNKPSVKNTNSDQNPKNQKIDSFPLPTGKKPQDEFPNGFSNLNGEKTLGETEEIEETPRTKRATHLLAGAKPATLEDTLSLSVMDINELNPENSSLEWRNSDIPETGLRESYESVFTEEVDLVGDRTFDAGKKIENAIRQGFVYSSPRNSMEPEEFQENMSLIPVNEKKSPQQIKLDKMSRPRSQVPKKKTQYSKSQPISPETSVTQLEDSITQEDKPKTSKAKPKNPNSKPKTILVEADLSRLQNSKSKQLNPPEVSTSIDLTQNTQTQREKNPNTTQISLPKRSTSPSSLSKSVEGYVSKSTNNTGEKPSESPAEDQLKPTENTKKVGEIDPNVLGSLTLLKTKGISRRRRSVADIENTQRSNRSSIEQLPQKVSQANMNTTGEGASPFSLINGLPPPLSNHQQQQQQQMQLQNQQQQAPPVVRPPAPPSRENQQLQNQQEQMQLQQMQRAQAQAPPQQQYQTQQQRQQKQVSYQSSDVPEYEPVDNSHECPDCGRHFAREPFQKHVKICSKVFLQKRKAFDSAKMRIEAIPELKEIHSLSSGKNKRKSGGFNQNNKKPLESKSSWREKSNSFRDAMKQARELNEALAAGGPLPAHVPSAPDPSLVPCPHCSRRFSSKAAERHIPQCQNIRAKPSVLKRGTGLNASSGALTGSGRNSSAKRGWV